MKIKEAVFLVSNTDWQKCPAPDRPEYAFIGRSNVGKSSLINSLVRRKDLAKTSQTPGKTQLINHFSVDNSWYLVDLPGYGYAKLSKSEREKFEPMIFGYLENRPNLICTFVLVDIRHDPMSIDLEFMTQLTEAGVPFYLVFTKADKLSKSQVEPKVKKYRDGFLQFFSEMPKYFVTSSVDGVGRDEIAEAIGELNADFRGVRR
ncbi:MULTISPECIES: ribosome biogenesis GTP-binding protein YihA/YsxC [Siphonobacter]|uniref:Probable GTP-binding protein EngB n=1 Tax=Siphonobacter curvatus TaxID=2094562 RepID=A0A2S7IST3_9BACT|nr:MULTISPECIES: ribosome biogenesis GTP-binding protein YihA/YsxC [Siphonobacter]PMD99389.1 YihA family ribosome biogenesis GTP-binding protein [Siphonobacter sp. BAB-5405]PQA60764.1 YihA family ribosome biogenesis GTP-binding protein [Siphonobacter curvatus]